MNPDPFNPEVGIASILTGVVVFVGLAIFLNLFLGHIWGNLLLVLLVVGEHRGWFDD